MVCKSLIAKPCINSAVGRNSELHKCLAFVHVRTKRGGEADNLLRGYIRVFRVYGIAPGASAWFGLHRR